MKKSSNKIKLNAIKNIIHCSIQDNVNKGLYRMCISVDTKLCSVDVKNNISNDYSLISSKLNEICNFEEDELDALFTFLGLCFPYILFDFYVDNKLMYHLPGDGVEYACASLYEVDFIDDYLKINGSNKSEGVRLEGYIHKPDIEVNNEIAYVFLNQNENTDEIIVDAIKRAYKPYTTVVSHILYIHTRTMETEFSKRELSIIADAVFIMIRDSLADYYVCQLNEFKSMPDRKVYNSAFLNDNGNKVKVLEEFAYDSQSDSRRSYSEAGARAKPFSLVEKTYLFEKYLIAETVQARSIYIIDLVAGIKLIHFLNLRKLVRGNDPSATKLDKPFVFFSEREARKPIMQSFDNFRKLGFNITEYGNNEFCITTAPPELKRFNFLGFSCDVTNTSNHPLSIEKLINLAAHRGAEMNYSEKEYVKMLIEHLENNPALINQDNEKIMKEISDKDIKWILQEKT